MKFLDQLGDAVKDVKELAALNGMSEPYQLSVGQK